MYSKSTHQFLPVSETLQHNTNNSYLLQGHNKHVEDINIWQRIEEFIISFWDSISIFIFSLLPDEPILM